MAEESRDKEEEQGAPSSSTAASNVRVSPSGGKEERGDSAKRVRRTDGDMASRGRRMFGLLNSTLSKAKEDNAKRNSGEAARKRAEVEARLQEKLKAEEEMIRQNKDLADLLKAQLDLAYNIVLERYSMEAMIKTRKAQKRRLASFMVTPSRYSREDGEEARRCALDERVIAAEVASCLAPVPQADRTAASDYPVYYLPKQMLPQQDDVLDSQEDRVDDAIDEADQAWDKQREAMQQNLTRIKSVVERIRGEMAQVARGEKVTDSILEEDE